MKKQSFSMRNMKKLLSASSYKQYMKLNNYGKAVYKLGFVDGRIYQIEKE